MYLPKKFSTPLKNSIESVLDTAKSNLQLPTTSSPAQTAPTTPSDPTTPNPFKRPSSSQRPSYSARPPSWIGPVRPVTPGPATMPKFPVLISYASPGLQPPVYLFTSLSDPQWSPLEMENAKGEDGEWKFQKAFAAEEGEYQYKFRLGPGDWWVVDEAGKVVDDGAGNVNNLVVVKGESAMESKMEQAKQVDDAPPAPTPQTPAIIVPDAPQNADVAPVAEQKAVDTPVLAPADPPASSTATPQPMEAPTQAPTPAPLFAHEEILAPVTRSTPSQPAQVQEPKPTPAPQTETAALITPLMKHETFATDPVDAEGNAMYADYDNDHDLDRSEPDTTKPQDEDNADDDEEDEDDDEAEGDDDQPEEPFSPLLRHESLTPDSHEETHAPLMRHESGGLENKHSLSPPASPSRASKKAPRIPAEADPSDPSLEMFPTDSNAIFEHIRRASFKLAAEDAAAITEASTSAMSPTSSHSLPSVVEEEDGQVDENEDLAELREAEEEEAERERREEEVDPLGEEGSVPVVLITEQGESEGFLLRPEPLMTPPMTPKQIEEVQEAVESVVVQAMGPEAGKQEADTGAGGMVGVLGALLAIGVVGLAVMVMWWSRR